MCHDLQIGSYRILSHIATGGMGEIYSATPADGVAKPIALKVIRSEIDADPSLRSMFETEAKLALSLSHANVVQTFAVERQDGRLLIAMEHVDGLDLAKMIQTVVGFLRQPMPYRHVLLIAINALEGLDYAHRRRGESGEELGIVHRDISPGNILVSREGEVKIADFGVARSAIGPRSSLVGELKGKLAYMAPEQLRGSKLDGRADIYSMGVVLYEMLTGKRPFTSVGASVIPDALAGAFPRPSLLRPDLPQPLEDIVMSAMAVDPRDRFNEASVMADWLREAAWQLGYVLSSIDLGEFVRSVQQISRESTPPHGLDRTEEATAAARPRSLAAL